MTVPLRAVQLRPPGRSRAYNTVTSYPSFSVHTLKQVRQFRPRLQRPSRLCRRQTQRVSALAPVHRMAIRPSDCIVAKAALYPPTCPTRKIKSRREIAMRFPNGLIATGLPVRLISGWLAEQPHSCEGTQPSGRIHPKREQPQRLPQSHESSDLVRFQMSCWV